MNERKPSICFIDDDPAELQRFRDNLSSRFVIATGTTLDDALADLKHQTSKKKPDLFVLDLYFPEDAPNTEDELSELRSAWSQYKNATAGYLSVLARLRQTTRGGQALASNIWKTCRSRRYVYFTRKATLEEGMDALRHGALDVIKKPDPNPQAPEANSPDAYDVAFRNMSSTIAANLSSAIRKSNWWWRHREFLYGALTAFGISILANLITRW